MSTNAKGTGIMSVEQMVAAGREKRASKIYKQESLEITDAAITATVNKAIAELENIKAGMRIPLQDVDAVKNQSILYLHSCAQSATLPTMSGLARALGCTRRTLERWIKNHGNEPTGEWLQTCHDLFADLLSSAALRNNANSIVSIFVLKAMYQLRDNLAIEVVPPADEPDEGEHSAEYYRKKYGDLIGE